MDTTTRFGPIIAESSKVAEATDCTITKATINCMMENEFNSRRFSCAPAAKHRARAPNKSANANSLSPKKSIITSGEDEIYANKTT